MAKRGYLTVFLASAVFNPFFMFFGATAGATRMAPWKFYLASAAGKIVKATYVAYLGALGDGLHIWDGLVSRLRCRTGLGTVLVGQGSRMGLEGTLSAVLTVPVPRYRTTSTTSET